MLKKNRIKVIYYSFCDKTCANDTMGWGTPTSQVTLNYFCIKMKKCC